MAFEKLDKLVSSLSDNPYFGAGFGLVGVGAGIAVSRQALAIGMLLFKRHCMMTLEITHLDSSYPWILNWLNTYHRRAQHLSVVTQFQQRESGNISIGFNFVPSVGVHFMSFNKKWIKIERERQETAIHSRSGIPFEKIKFTCFGGDKKIFIDMLEHARDLEVSMHEGKTVIYEPRTDRWEPFGEPRPRRQFETVILDRDVAQTILQDVQEFLSTREWYSQRGVPYRRGYLLYGPPGCGKTSYIMALAGKLEYDICQMNLSESTLADDRLNHLLNVAPSKSIILLEDIDAACFNRELDEDIRYQGMRRLTLSGLLNALDGVSSSEERIIFMTTNYIERLDPALIRPGRVDIKTYVGHASDDQLCRAFDKFYPNNCPTDTSPEAKKFLEAINSAKSEFLRTASHPLNLSMADIQSYFLLYKDQPGNAILNVGSWIKKNPTAESDSSNCV